LNRVGIAAVVILGIGLVSIQVVSASTIDFETAPDGSTPIDNSNLTSPYAIDGGGSVRFFFDANGNNQYDAGVDALPVFEKIGVNKPDGFESNFANSDDIAAPGFENQLGTFFLRQPDGIGTVPGPFIAAYNSPIPINAISGEIWDIDGQPAQGTEQWRVDVLNASGDVLATTTSPLGKFAGPNSLDGKPWEFSFVGLPASADAVRLTFIGTKQTIGLGFNNFSFTTVPEPSALELAALAAVMLVPVLRVRRC
jgi:hypothetical protein